MTDSLGLSIGMTNLVAARVGREPVMRRALLTVFDDRPPRVGLAAEAGENSDSGGGLVLTGFVDRVGDPVPLIAADGSAHRGEQVLAEALDAMARTVDGGAPVAIAVPAHWGPGAVGALRGALRNHPDLSPGGTPPALIPDSVAALAALQAAPGLPDQGVVVLCDFGGSGTSITLADASANLDAIGQTVRHPDFSGDGIDQLLLNHVVTGIAAANDADPAGTAAVSSLARLRDECRRAKERLSAETATVIPAQLPGMRSDYRVTRSELETLISDGLAGVVRAVENTLQRNNITPASVSAVATVGGGAAIPVITQQLSERLRVPVVTTPQSQLNVAAGAALVADRGLGADAPTGMAPIAPDAPTGMAPVAPDAPTGLAPAAWAAGAAGLAAADSAADGASSATFRALAWSQDDAPSEEPVPYEGADYTADTGAAARPPVAFIPPADDLPEDAPPLPWYKRPTLLFGVAAVAALAAISGLAVTLTGSTGDSTPVTETSTTYSMEPSPAGPPPPPVTTVTVGPDGVATTTVSQPPPPPPPPSSTTTTPTSSTTSATTTTTTTTTTTRTTTTTTRPTTTTPPPTTTQPPPTTTVAPDPPDPVTPDPPDPITTVVPDDGA